MGFGVLEIGVKGLGFQASRQGFSVFGWLAGVWKSLGSTESHLFFGLLGPGELWGFEGFGKCGLGLGLRAWGFRVSGLGLGAWG